MSYTFSHVEDDERQLEVTVSVDEAHMQKKIRETARKLSGQVRIPGFRKGKLPYHVLVRRLGAETIRREAVDDMTQHVFEAMMDQIEEEPHARTSLQDIQLEPTVFTFVVPLSPVVKLGDYREARKEIEAIEIAEEAVQEALERIQERHVVLEPVERPVEAGDLVTLKGKGTASTDSDDEPLTIFNQDSVDLLLDAEKLVFGEAFVDHVVGMSAGDEKSFDIQLGEDFVDDDLAGQTASFNMEVLDVKNRILPAIDDDLAKEEGDYETLEALREAVTKNLHDHATQHAKNDRIEAFVTDLLEEANVNFPPILVEEEINNMVDNLKQRVERAGLKWEEYLDMDDTTEEEFRDNVEEDAEQNVERNLVLGEFIKTEKIQATDEALQAKMAQQFGDGIDNEEVREYMMKFLAEGGGMNNLASEVILDAADERIQTIWLGTAPSFEELEAAEEEE